VVVTDPGGGALREEALRDGLMSFEVPRNVPARYSVLTPVALLPGALAGADVRGVLSGAHAAAEQTAGEDLRTNPAYLLASTLHSLALRHGRRHVVFAAGGPTLVGTARQAARLVQESLGRGNAAGGAFSCSFASLPREADALAQRCVEGPDDAVVVLIDADKRSRDRLLPKASAGLSGLAGKSLSAVSSARTAGLRMLLGASGVPVIDVRLPSVAANTFGALHMALMLAASFGARLIAPSEPGAAGAEVGAGAEARLAAAVTERLRQL
jgi:glucose-6-phosphate isomerase